MYPGSPALYEELQKSDWYYEASRPEFPFAKALTKPGIRVLEIGSGEGNFLSLLPPEVQAVGLEFNDASIDKCRARGLKVEKLPIAEYAAEHACEFDLVCSFQVLEHVSEPLNFLEPALACLKPGGRLVISVPNDEAPMAEMTNAWLNLPPHHLSRWRLATFRVFAAQHGLTIEDSMTDAVAPEHVRWIREQGASNWLAAKLGLQRQPIDNRLAWKFMLAGGKALAALTGSRFEGRLGHSITVVMKTAAAG